jgi:dynein heavy chain
MYFDKLLLIRALREDRALLGVQEYVMDALGERYADSRPLGIRALTEEANKFTPAIFILPTGADPTNAINELARKMKKKVDSISMGQGQEPAARGSCCSRACSWAAGCCSRTATSASR